MLLKDGTCGTSLYIGGVLEQWQPVEGHQDGRGAEGLAL